MTAAIFRDLFILVILYAMIAVWMSCHYKNPAVENREIVLSVDSLTRLGTEENTIVIPDGWVDMEQYLEFAHFHIAYATAENFTGTQIYDCPACWLLKPVAQKLKAAENLAWERGFRLIIYDCYRPAPYQQRLWDAKPDPRYVMHPSKGSYHSRGLAVDLSLLNASDNGILPMGSDFDHLGHESHWSYTGITQEAKQNREILRWIMESAGFKTISSEWWHFEARDQTAPVFQFTWPCP